MSMEKLLVFAALWNAVQARKFGIGSGTGEPSGEACVRIKRAYTRLFRASADEHPRRGGQNGRALAWLGGSKNARALTRRTRSMIAEVRVTSRARRDALNLGYSSSCAQCGPAYRPVPSAPGGAPVSGNEQFLVDEALPRCATFADRRVALDGGRAQEAAGRTRSMESRNEQGRLRFQEHALLLVLRQEPARGAQAHRRPHSLHLRRVRRAVHGHHPRGEQVLAGEIA